MALIERDPAAVPDVLDRFFGHWPEWFRRPWTALPEAFENLLRVDEFRANGNLVIRAEMAGIDPDKDVEISVSDGILHIEAHREFEEKEEGKNYYRREMRYGSFRRDFLLPEGCSEEDVVGDQRKSRSAITGSRVPRSAKVALTA